MPELIWVNQGEWFGRRILKHLCQIGVPLVNYANDNPFGGKAANRFNNYIAAIPFYDLHVVTFEENIKQLEAAGANNVMRVFLCADEVAHTPRSLSAADHENYCGQVSYISQWAPERGPFLAKLIELGVPLSLWGDRWNKAREWSVIKLHWKGPAIYDGNGFAKVIQCAKISLCLLSKSNRNQHTGRSLSIPSLGGLLCAERTDEHKALYAEGIEAVFFDDAEECARLCHELLADEPRRKAIAAAGHARALRNGHYNERVMARILDEAIGRGTSPAQSVGA
jgi:hypothetical protein